MEPGILVLMAVAGLLVGVLVGVVLGRVRKGKDVRLGVLYVDPNAPEGQGLFLEQTVPASELAGKTSVSFDVVLLHRNSHE
jgi:hypothetical protein